MASCYSILVWKIPRTEEPSRLQFMGPKRVVISIFNKKLTTKFKINKHECKKHRLAQTILKIKAKKTYITILQDFLYNCDNEASEALERLVRTIENVEVNLQIQSFEFRKRCQCNFIVSVFSIHPTIATGYQYFFFLNKKLHPQITSSIIINLRLKTLKNYTKKL